jgi:resuscitation-promoting factor RpfB
VRIAAQAGVLAMVAGATSAFVVLHKDVTIDVDGKSRHVEAFGRTVGDVLAGVGVSVNSRDLVAPAVSDHAESGGEIVVRHGRDLALDVDGEHKTVWTTALTVGEAVDDLGIRGGDARLSASRSAPLGRDTLRVSTLKTIHLVVDGQVVDGLSNADTVRDALRDIGLVLSDGDHVSVPLDATAVDGLVVLVTRATTDGTTVQETIPFETKQVDDPKLPKGQQVVQTKGRVGVRTTTYQLDTVGGVVVGRTPIASVVTTAPVAQVVRVGTMAVNINVDPGSAQELGRQLAAARGWGDDQFSCLLLLWNKESGWRVNAANPSGAYGIPQALPGSKMASVAADWKTNPATQITWGLGYIAGRYGTPCAAWAHSESSGWY